MEKTKITEEEQMFLYDYIKQFTKNRDLLLETMLLIMQHEIEFTYDNTDILDLEIKQAIKLANQRIRRAMHDGYARDMGYLKEKRKYNEEDM